MSKIAVKFFQTQILRVVLLLHTGIRVKYLVR